MEALAKISTFIDRVCSFAIILLFSVMTVAYFGQVVFRYFFDYGLSWSEELTIYLNIWAVMIGVAMLAKRKNIINLTILDELLPASFKTRLFFIQTVFTIILFALLFYFSFDFIKLAGTQVSTNMRVPKAYVYSIFPVTFALIVFQAFVSIAVDGRKGARS